MKKLVNKKWFCLLFCFVVSSLIILFTSKCSPLYPFNDWVDANAFFTTGNVLDYLRYKSIQDTKDLGADTILREETDEIPDDGADSERAKYR